MLCFALWEETKCGMCIAKYVMCFSISYKQVEDWKRLQVSDSVKEDGKKKKNQTKVLEKIPKDCRNIWKELLLVSKDV